MGREDKTGTTSRAVARGLNWPIVVARDSVRDPRGAVRTSRAKFWARWIRPSLQSGGRERRVRTAGWGPVSWALTGTGEVCSETGRQISVQGRRAKGRHRERFLLAPAVLGATWFEWRRGKTSRPNWMPPQSYRRSRTRSSLGRHKMDFSCEWMPRYSCSTSSHIAIA